MQPPGTHKEGKKFRNFNADLLCVGTENEAARYPLFWKSSRVSEKHVTFNLELTSLSEEKITLENLSMRIPLFLNFVSLLS